MLEPMYFVDERAASYATVTDLIKTFNEEMHSLYLLSFLLTADHDRAEECLVSAIGECVEGVGVFTDWARSWTRRAVLKHALRMLMPAPVRTYSVSFLNLEGPAMSGENKPFASILLLDAFERCVFVMSVLEGQPEEECAILLGCSRREVMMARVLALERLTNTDTVYRHEALQA